MMSTPHFNYSQYYLSHHLTSAHYHAVMAGQDMDHNTQHAQSPQSQVNTDPALQLYYSGYDTFQNGHHDTHHLLQHQQHLQDQQQLPSLMIPQQPPMHPHGNNSVFGSHSPASQSSDYADATPIDGEKPLPVTQIYIYTEPRDE